MGVRENVTSEDVFDEMDTDKSRLVSCMGFLNPFMTNGIFHLVCYS